MPWSATSSGAPIATLRERRKQETRRLLETAALELFGRRGFNGTSVDQIAAEAGVSRTTFFRYFPSKEAVVFADDDATTESFWTILASRPRSENALRAFEEALVTLSRRTEADPKERRKALARWALIAATPGLRERWARTTELRIQEIAVALARREGVSAPTARHLIASAVAVELVQQVNLEWQAAGGEVAGEGLVRERFRILRELAAG
jgi:AcrR family transcriptional regulator